MEKSPVVMPDQTQPSRGGEDPLEAKFFKFYIWDFDDVDVDCDDDDLDVDVFDADVDVPLSDCRYGWGQRQRQHPQYCWWCSEKQRIMWE